MITLKQINYALSVSRNLHFKKAADECSVSPSTLSNAITEMENQLGYEIFERDNKSFVGADYFYEEIRKKLFLNYGTETLYSEGLVIKTSLNTDLQQLAKESLVKGLIQYDKNQGWRGAIGNLNE